MIPDNAESKKQDIALMRYLAIAPIITELNDDYSSLADFFRGVSAKGITAPDGTLKHYAPGTIRAWYYDYKESGFDGLIPSGRSDSGRPRKIDAELMHQIKYFKENYPKMSSSAIYRQLKENGSIKHGELSESTLNRFLNQLAHDAKTGPAKDMRRYERPHINEVWYGDTCHGPYLKLGGKKVRVYVIALIDDASRFVLGAGCFLSDNFISLLTVIKSAVLKYGKPALFTFDNGSAYKNRQMLLLAARIGSAVHYNKPYAPTGKAKLERWFRTLRGQWLNTLDMDGFSSLDELNTSLLAYMTKYNNTIHSSLNGKSPTDRYFNEPGRFRHLKESETKTAFLLELERRVSNDGVVMIGNTMYEVEPHFAKKKVIIRFSPDMEEIFIATKDGTHPLRLLNKHENAHVMRGKIHLTADTSSGKEA